jgi:hypothetical protein
MRTTATVPPCAFEDVYELEGVVVSLDAEGEG